MMLSYQHAYHAGNHADVLKHSVLTSCLGYLNRKDTAWWYIDTHSGSGWYDMTQGPALKKGEYLLGVSKIWQAEQPPELLLAYLSSLRRANPSSALKRYPGSPALAAGFLRPQDRGWFYEIHPQESVCLQRDFAERPNIRCQSVDGLGQLKALLPPPSRRALIFIDPSYEGGVEYDRVELALKTALQRFRSGIFITWYPLLAAQGGSAGSSQFGQRLMALRELPRCRVELCLDLPGSGAGMIGSGMVVYNPPYLLQQQLNEALPWLLAKLACPDQPLQRNSFFIDWQAD